MGKVVGSWWLGAFVCFMPAALMASGGKCGSAVSNCQQVPEGGSTAIYLIGAGATCLVAMFVRSRLSKRTVS